MVSTLLNPIGVDFMIVYDIKNNKYRNSHDEIITLQDYKQQRFTIPFSTFIQSKRTSDIYTGYEKIPFEDRHPIYKAILKLEFEDVIKSWNNSTS